MDGGEQRHRTNLLPSHRQEGVTRITLRQRGDSHSLDIVRFEPGEEERNVGGGKHIAYLQWHAEREPRIVFCGEKFDYITIEEIRYIMEQYTAMRARRNTPKSYHTSLDGTLVPA